MAVRAFRIELERPGGVYYASELIRGKVHLTTTGDIATRDVQIRFRGEGHCQFAAGRGYDRADVVGHKVYQDTRYTMFGNACYTSVQENTGPHCEWCRANGDGIMYIPIELNANGQAPPVALRVCDNDWGSKADILGEVLIDVAELTGEEEEHTYKLRRWGKVVHGGKAPATITLAGRLVPYDSLVGQRGATSSTSHILTLQAVRAGNLPKSSGLNAVYCQAYPAPEARNAKEGLPVPDEYEILPAGEHVFSFAIPIRTDAPGSCEVTDEVFVRYHLSATLDRIKWLNPNARCLVTVIPNRPLPPASLLAPAVAELCEDDCNWFSGFFRSLRRGRPTLRARLDRQVYAPGETLGLTADVTNDSDQLIKLVVCLRREVFMQSTDGAPYESEVYSHYTIFERLVPPGPAMTISSSELESAKMPSVPPSFFGAEGSCGKDVDPVTWTYVLEFHLATLDEDSCQASVDIPVFVSPTAVYSSALADRTLDTLKVLGSQNGWGMADLVQKVVNKDLFYFPAISAGDDLGTVAQRVPLGERIRIRDLAAHQVEVLSDTELTYQHQASNADEAELVPYAVVGDSPGDAVHDDGKSNTSMNAGALAELLAKLNDGNKCSALRRWTRTHLHETAQLSPAQIKDVMAKVPSCIEQPDVARELALALSLAGGPCLTCARVAAAVNACPLMREEVALAMIQVGVADAIGGDGTDARAPTAALQKLQPKHVHPAEELIFDNLEVA